MNCLRYIIICILILGGGDIFSQEIGRPIFKDGDRVCFVGNSITNNAQFYHFINLYYATRYPDQKVTFYNCGISGDVTQGILNRMGKDILVHNPTWSVLMIGMNDVRRNLYSKSSENEKGIVKKREEALNLYRKNLEIIVQELTKDGRKLILQKPSIYDQTACLPEENLFGVNDALKKCADYTQTLADKYKLPVVDYWSILSKVNELVQKKDSSATIIGKDRVHPGAPGHLIMAYEFLKSTGADEYVSKMVVRRKLKVQDSQSINCTIRNVDFSKGCIKFEALEKSLPFPVSEEAKTALSLVPFTDSFNKEILQVEDIPVGNYQLLIDSIEIGVYSSTALKKGINLATEKSTPQYRQAVEIMNLFARYRETQARYRSIVSVELNHLPDSLKNAPLKNKEIYLNQYLERKFKGASNYSYYASLFKSYILNKPLQGDIEEKLPEIITSVYQSNKPIFHTFTLRRSVTDKTSLSGNLKGSNEEKAGSSGKIPMPSAPQLRWQNYERIMFLHFAPNTWTGLGQDDNSLPLSRINPEKLNTDQWCQVARSWGAKMIIFVAKHSGGFCWWQTNTTEYGVRNIPWKNGKGDVLAEISKSCDKYGLDLGVYIYPGDKNWGAGLGSGGRTSDPGKQEAYNRVFRQQLTEVLSNYKPMKEVWFDGSCVVDVSDILKKYAGDAVVFQGPQATIRWVGNEKGIVPYPNWYTIKSAELKAGGSTALQSDPDGDAYAPVEADVPFLLTPKSYRWFWAPNTDQMMLSVNGLMDIYNKSVGRGSVLLLNATPDTTGLIPESHVERYKSFGEALSKRFSNPVALCSGQGNILEIKLGNSTTVNGAVMREDLSQGQRIRKYILEGYSEGKWVTLSEGSSVGSMRIDEFSPVKISKTRLRITEAAARPAIQKFALYNFDELEEKKNVISENKVVKMGSWNNHTFSSGWQEFSYDLTSQFKEKVGQFELKFRPTAPTISIGKSGLEFKDWSVELYGMVNPDAVRNAGDGVFLINNSQDISHGTTTRVSFRIKIRSGTTDSTGVIELRMIDSN